MMGYTQHNTEDINENNEFDDYKLDKWNEANEKIKTTFMSD